MTDELQSFISQMNYLTPIRYTSGNIVEYDIRSANITMLRKYGMIDNNYYQYLNSLPKLNREVEIGKLIKTNREYYDIIQKGIINAKIELFQKNRINPASVVRIANDAVYINSSVRLQYTTFDDVEFRIKSISSVMLVLKKIIIFYWRTNEGINIDALGLGDNNSLHYDYLLGFIAQIIDCVEMSSAKDALDMFTQFYEEYINLRLDKYFYRELRPESMFRYKYTAFLATEINDVKDVDIGYNLYILRELYSIQLEKYNAEIRR